MSTNRRWSSGMFATEDWWSVWIGLALFGAGLLALAGLDLVGWMARPRPWEWTDLNGAFAWSKWFAASGASYASWHPVFSWLVAYAVFTVLFAIGAHFQRLSVHRFVFGFTALYVITPWARRDRATRTARMAAGTNSFAITSQRFVTNVKTTNSARLNPQVRLMW